MHKKGQKIHSSFHRYFLRRKRSRTLFARFPRIFGVLSTPNTRLQAHLHYTLTTTVCSKVFVDVFFRDRSAIKLEKPFIRVQTSTFSFEVHRRTSLPILCCLFYQTSFFVFYQTAFGHAVISKTPSQTIRTSVRCQLCSYQ